LTATGKTYDTFATATLEAQQRCGIGRRYRHLGGTASGTYADKNVGVNKAITVTGNTLTGTDAGNYILVQQTGLTGTIAAAS